MRFTHVFFLLWVLIPKQVFSNTDTTQQRLSLGLHYGRGLLWAHRPNMTHLVGESIQSFELELEHLEPNSSFDAYHNLRYGLRLHFSDLGSEITGNAFGISPYFNFQLLELKKFSMRSSFGMGLAYLDNAFDLYTNRKNIAIGSALNLYISFNIQVHYRLSNQLAWHLRSQLTHFSNAAFSMPNLGLNLPAFSTGFSLQMLSSSASTNTRASPVFENNSLVLVSGFGLRSIEVLNTNRYPVFRLSMEYMVQPKAKWAWSSALDVFYNSAIYHRLEKQASASPFQYNTQLGVSAKYHQVIGPVQIMTGMGIYALDKGKRDGLFYHKLGARVHVSEQWFLNSELISHWAKADHLEFGIAYCLK